MENARTKRPRPLADMPRIAGKLILRLKMQDPKTTDESDTLQGERSDPLGKVLAGFPARSPVNGYGPIEGSVAFVVVLSEYVLKQLRTPLGAKFSASFPRVKGFFFSISSNVRSYATKPGITTMAFSASTISVP
ncbi:hypothetical protein L1987_88279 [Smallanthus sonchifolius]|nr:hypothetical protein L1987_89932 [Smallanthus sonchifolius]KAI3664348.1 hypothetical protein L1987_89907 [Smallanthus sonchifolius]KAI3664467.1 hypothetical protein L1987_89786 [Smallanthus sonchifolius]KAI3664523.1 hypothetical protein L1987_89724 [Smallanthus sonchifolius]KAI3664730.1 hypothetical protein L1987_89490 [Smallanthus sonchifolius]